MEVDAVKESEQDDTAMTDAAAEGEPEVQSPLKKAPEPEQEASDPAAAEEDEEAPKSDKAKAAPLPATSSKALAASKRKGLLVAKSATGAQIAVYSTVRVPLPFENLRSHNRTQQDSHKDAQIWWTTVCLPAQAALTA
jgi:hypothetical protein